MQLKTLGNAAQGTIGPKSRTEAGEITKEEVEEFARRVFSGEFDEAVGLLGPNAAAGTFTLVVADALTQQRWYAPGMTADEHSKVAYDWLLAEADTPDNRLIIPRQCIDGRPVVEGESPSQLLIGDHGPDCGAQTRFSEIFPFMAANLDLLRQVTEQNGVAVSDSTQQLIHSRISGLLGAGYIVPSDALQRAFVLAGGEHTTPRLQGGHVEIGARRNARQSTTLNRLKTRAAYPGRKLDMFNIDTWSFKPSSEIITAINDGANVQALVVAMEYFNTATALVLCDESLILGETPAA